MSHSQPVNRDGLRLGLSVGLLNRSGADARTADQAREDWDRKDATVLALHEGRTPVLDSRPPKIQRLPTHRISQGPEAAGSIIYLGRDPDGGPVFLLRLRSAPSADAGWVDRWRGLREAGMHLSALDQELLTVSVAIDSWHATHRHCPRCGSQTTVERGGWMRRCTRDGSEHYPRTDPAVIMLIRDQDDRALLGRQAAWPAKWMSTLAGFVAPGESAEAAVRREVLEEVGVEVGEVQYRGSQPWPFPASLMLGFTGRALTTHLVPDPSEIADADWFSRASLQAAGERGEILLPPPISIARSLIEEWFGQPLPGQWLRGRPR